MSFLRTTINYSFLKFFFCHKSYAKKQFKISDVKYLSLKKKNSFKSIIEISEQRFERPNFFLTNVGLYILPLFIILFLDLTLYYQSGGLISYLITAFETILCLVEFDVLTFCGEEEILKFFFIITCLSLSSCFVLPFIFLVIFENIVYFKGSKENV